MLTWREKYHKFDNVKDIMRAILELKRIDKSEIRDYINCTQGTRPYEMLDNIKEACEAIKKHKCIQIVSDFDSDGVCGAYVMYNGLKSVDNILGWDIFWHLPERVDGYGLSEKSVNIAIENQATCIITVDNGISATDAVEYAKEKGIEVIITDHHQPPETLPKCLIVDPQIDNYPFKYICGAMVAFKFINALYDSLDLEMPDELYDDLLSFAAVATISDVMKLTDENRTYVAEGLKILNETKNIGMKTLLTEAKISNVKAETIAFKIGPMINAAGRLASPTIALNLFLSEDIVECERLAKQLINLNNERRKIQKETIDSMSEDVLKDDFIIFYIPDAGKGVLGTIASSISDRYRKPCFVLSGHDRLTGSGRSVGGYSILDFINTSRDILAGGGHKAAAGIAVDENNLEELRKRSNEHYRKWLATHDVSTENVLFALGEINIDLCTMRFAENLESLEPYGVGNPKITFVSKNVRLEDCTIMGETKNAIKMTLIQNGVELQAVGFGNLVEQFHEDMIGKNVDIAFTIEINEFANKRSVQLQLIDFHLSDNDSQSYFDNNTVKSQDEKKETNQLQLDDDGFAKPKKKAKTEDLDKFIDTW